MTSTEVSHIQPIPAQFEASSSMAESELVLHTEKSVSALVQETMSGKLGFSRNVLYEKLEAITCM